MTGEVSVPPHADRARRWSPVELMFLLIVVIMAAITLWAASTPWWDWLVLFIAAPVWLAVGVIWIAAGLAGLIRRRNVRSWQAWLLAPTIVLLTFAAMIFDVAVLARFALSRPAFDQLTQQPSPDGRAGLYDISEFKQTGFGFQVQVSCSGLLSCSGFAYSPNGRPGRETRELQPNKTAYWHLDGPWYMWARRYT